MEPVEYLKSRITKESSLSDIIDIFEEMCLIPIETDEEEMILFETGTFSFTGQSLFYFSLVRQYSNMIDDEYFQIHVDVLYEPNDENSAFSGNTWFEENADNIFESIKGSDAYKYAEKDKIFDIEIFLDET